MTDRYPATDGDVVIIGSLNADLVVRTQRHPEPGETVLLSPACASFDQFRDFEHRGEVFKSVVETLKSVPERLEGAAK